MLLTSTNPLATAFDAEHHSDMRYIGTMHLILAGKQLRARHRPLGQQCFRFGIPVRPHFEGVSTYSTEHWQFRCREPVQVTDFSNKPWSELLWVVLHFLTHCFDCNPSHLGNLRLVQVCCPGPIIQSAAALGSAQRKTPVRDSAFTKTLQNCCSCMDPFVDTWSKTNLIVV